MGSPGLLANLIPAGADELPRKIRDIERQMTELAPSVARSFAPVFERLEAQDAALIAQDDVILAQQAQILTLLGSVVLPDSFNSPLTGFSTGGVGYEAKASVTLTCPAGFTKAVVSASAYNKVSNTTAATILMQGIATINGASGPNGFIQGIASGTLGTVNAEFYAVVPGLTGGATFAVLSQVYTSQACGASAGNTSVINGTVQWFR